MKHRILLAAIPLLAACTAHTPIGRLDLPAPSTIHGIVAQEGDGESFTLKDSTGRIEVEWEGETITPALKAGEKITVSGVVDEDDSLGQKGVFIEEFDAFCIKRADGTVHIAVPNCPL